MSFESYNPAGGSERGEGSLLKPWRWLGRAALGFCLGCVYFAVVFSACVWLAQFPFVVPSRPRPVVKVVKPLVVTKTEDDYDCTDIAYRENDATDLIDDISVRGPFDPDMCVGIPGSPEALRPFLPVPPRGAGSRRASNKP